MVLLLCCWLWVSPAPCLSFPLCKMGLTVSGASFQDPLAVQQVGCSVPRVHTQPTGSSEPRAAVSALQVRLRACGSPWMDFTCPGSCWSTAPVPHLTPAGTGSLARTGTQLPTELFTLGGAGPATWACYRAAPPLAQCSEQGPLAGRGSSEGKEPAPGPGGVRLEETVPAPLPWVTARSGQAQGGSRCRLVQPGSALAAAPRRGLQACGCPAPPQRRVNKAPWQAAAVAWSVPALATQAPCQGSGGARAALGGADGGLDLSLVGSRQVF